MDIREFWHDITDEKIDMLHSLGLENHEWLIVKHLFTDKRIGEREISDDDIEQGLPSHKHETAHVP
jgi:hypothetical protein